MTAPDRAPAQWVVDGHVALGPQGEPVAEASLGLLELWLPLAARRWWLLAALLLGAVAGFGASMLQIARYSGVASFVVQPVLRPSQGVAPGSLPALAGLLGAGGTSPVDLHLAVLRSQAMSDRILERFELQRVWALPQRGQARLQLARRVSFGAGRRDGMVQIVVQDENPQRAAAMANQYIVELRAMLLGFALEEAQQRRRFYDSQLERARQALAEAQQALQRSGFDAAALRAQPAAATERYARLATEVAAAEARLATTLRVRSEGSAEVKQLRAELAALRQQLGAVQAPAAGQESPRDAQAGRYVDLLRSYREAELLAESITRQAQAARVDEAADAVPFQVLDRALPAEWPSSPQPLLWAAAGGLLLPGLLAGIVLLRHRRALARLEPAWQQRLARVQSVLPGR